MPEQSPPTAHDLFNSPDYYLWKFEGSVAVFLPMTRDTYHRSIFTDDRIIFSNNAQMRVEVEQLVQLSEQSGTRANSISYIFHMAHCGSTLLARALDVLGKTIVYREPMALRQIGLSVAKNHWHNESANAYLPVMNAASKLLSKKYTSEENVIIKANVPVNLYAQNLVKTAEFKSGIFLYNTLENYLLSIFKHKSWLDSITDTFSSALDHAFNARQAVTADSSHAVKVAAMWAFQIKTFNSILQTGLPVKSLDAETFYSDPLNTLEGAAKLFGLDLEQEELSSIVQGELFSQYSKDPSYIYTNQDRVADKQALKQSLSNEIREAKEWLEENLDPGIVPESLPHPLTGKESKLI